MVFYLYTEDFGVLSININYSSSGKLQVIIPRDEYKKLVGTLDRYRLAKRPGNYYQYVRYEYLFLYTIFLDDNDIRYKCFIQAPGIAVLVFPGTVYYRFNLSTNIAKAINYIPEGWELPTAKEYAYSPD